MMREAGFRRHRRKNFYTGGIAAVHVAKKARR